MSKTLTGLKLIGFTTSLFVVAFGNIVAMAAVQSCEDALMNIQQHVQSKTLGQEELIEGLMIALLNSEHVLIEGPQGTSKTRTVKALAESAGLETNRIQFTPDTMPSDITGINIYDPIEREYKFMRGPIFTNVLLADEINRASPKSQAALLEPMEEGQVTLNGETHKISKPFMVIATQNPQDQQGTYALPEAQLDRFMLKIVVKYSDFETELKILLMKRNEEGQDESAAPLAVMDSASFNYKDAARLLTQVEVPKSVLGFIINITDITRNTSFDRDLSRWIEQGISPRGTYAVDRAARSYAALQNRKVVTVEDVIHVAPMALRHRIKLSDSAEADGVTTDQIIEKILSLAKIKNTKVAN